MTAATSPGGRRPARGAIAALAAIGRRFDARGWVLGTSGNFSIVLGRAPLRLAMTASSVHKGRLGPRDFVEIDGVGRVVSRSDGRPSAESLIHLEIVRARGAGAVLHTHSIWSTLVSEAASRAGGIAIEGYEMLKGLEGVTTHEHREWLPVVENSQDMAALSRAAAAALAERPEAHGLLIRRHGLYTWGADLAQAERHVEILEFLLEAVGRSTVGVKDA